MNVNMASEYVQEMEHSLHSLNPMGITEASKLWVSLVRPGAIWDFKPDFVKSGAFIPDTKNKQLGKYQFHYQAIANIHYGYVGTAAGFSSAYLQAGAGFFQNEKTRGNITTFYDDPFDNYWIRFGIYLYNTYGADGLTEEEFLKALDEFYEKYGAPGEPLTPGNKQKTSNSLVPI